jgi:hypothetical protein
MTALRQFEAANNQDLPGVESTEVPTPAPPSLKEDPAMRRFALLLGVALSLISSSAVAQNCDGFVDVLASSPFCPDVTWLKTYGITKGCDATHYCPTESVNRLQMAAFMHRLGNNPAFVNGGNAFGTTAVLGTTDNNPLNMIVDNVRAVMVQPAIEVVDGFGYNPNVIAGQAGNSVAGGVAGATIAGGGGCNPGTGGTCTVASANQVTATFGTVGGGAGNTADSFGTVAGGQRNTASGILSTVGGGVGNTASGSSSAVAGGLGNMASGEQSTVAGGNGNTAIGSFSAVAGGSGNTAGGSNSTVAGGLSNVASAAYTFAAGFHANADGRGCFVFADFSSANSTSCFNPNVFVARALNGFYFYTGGTSDPTYTGAQLVGGSNAWSALSDRNSKENIDPVDPRSVLDRLVAIPIATWNWKTQPPTIRHMGPMAQDFHFAFGLGEDDKHITTVDEEGVALAAIQGLNAKIEALQREIAELSQRVQKAEALAAEVVTLKSALAELQRGRQTVAVK